MLQFISERADACMISYGKTLTGAGVVLVHEKRLFGSEEYAAIQQVARMARANSQKPAQRNVR